MITSVNTLTSDHLIRVIITKAGIGQSGYSVMIKKGPNKMTSFNTSTKRGARKAADRFLKTRGKYTHPVLYVEEGL